MYFNFIDYSKDKNWSVNTAVCEICMDKIKSFIKGLEVSKPAQSRKILNSRFSQWIGEANEK